MKVIILTEGTRATGYGHITRCLAIYQAFEEKGVKPILVTHCDDRGKRFLLGERFNCFNWLIELKKLFEIVVDSDILIIDSYLAPKEIYIELTSRVRRAVFIDDFMRIEYPQGVIINGTIGAEHLGYEIKDQQELLLGVKYVPLRKEFWKVPLKTNKTSVRDVLITLGGSDKRDISFVVLDIMLQKFHDLNYTVVTGSELNIIAQKKYIDKKNIKLAHSLNAASMLDLIMKCDIAISAAGQTLYELARVGVSTIAIGVAQNQQNNMLGWIENKFIPDALWHDDKYFREKILELFNRVLNKNYRDSIIESIPAIVDGQGARRIIAKLYNN